MLYKLVDISSFERRHEKELCSSLFEKANRAPSTLVTTYRLTMIELVSRRFRCAALNQKPPCRLIKCQLPLIRTKGVLYAVLLMVSGGTRLALILTTRISLTLVSISCLSFALS